MEEIPKKKYTPGIALQKIQSYCAYQERSHYEVREKLYSYGLYKSDVEKILTELITSNYLSEERFACAYASGKFRIKRWGRNKIKQGLKAKFVSEYNIKKALREIDEEEYAETLKKLAEKKSQEITIKKIPVKKHKIASYLISRGFEADLVWEEINTLLKNGK